MMHPTKTYATGHVLAEDEEVIARAIRAIKQRRLREVEVRFSSGCNVMQMRRNA